MNLKRWCLQIWGVNTLSCLQYKNIIVDKNQSIPYFPPHCGIQCSISSKVCPLRRRLPLSYHKNSSQIFDATKLWKHTIPLTYNTKTLISNISVTHRFSPQMRLIAYPDHKTTLKNKYVIYSPCSENSRTGKNYSNRTFCCRDILCWSGTKPTSQATTFFLFSLFFFY